MAARFVARAANTLSQKERTLEYMGKMGTNRKILAGILLLAVAVTNLQAQEIYGEAAVSAGRGSGALALGAIRQHALGKAQRLSLGYGVRYTAFVGANQYYTTAPAKFTSPVQNITTIFSATLQENIDTITTTTTFVHAFNLVAQIGYRITPALSLGFNIDVVGLSFGGRKDFNILSSQFDPGQRPVQSARPTRYNVLLTSDNDIGSLNSEFFAALKIGEQTSVKAGLTFVFTEYQTQQPLSFDGGRIMNDRYRLKESMLMVGVQRKLSKTK